jgi:uncharacterized protein YecE (DUF72 family)
VTFYRLPRAETFQNWRKKVPADFRFAVKLSRYITHYKRLREVEQAWGYFQQNVSELGNKRGPILVQFPPQFAKDIGKLQGFLDLLAEKAPRWRYAFEFRHPSWYDQEVFELFNKSKLQLTLVIADSKRWPVLEENIGKFVYIRMHGAVGQYSSKYSTATLRKVAERLKRYLNQKLDVYVYFNNDKGGYAVDNARTLLKLMGQER